MLMTSLKTSKETKKTKSTKAQRSNKENMATLKHVFAFALILILLVTLITQTLSNSKDDTISLTAIDEDVLTQFVYTEETLIGVMRHYIERMEQQISTLKKNVEDLHQAHNIATTSGDNYLTNPVNVIIILKRFTSDWNALIMDARNLENIQKDLAQNMTTKTESLLFPTELDFDDAVSQLLRIQEIYKLEPQRLATGELQGIKLGSEMSWSDCLEIGRKSNENGDYKIAKYWIETALGKLPTTENTNTTDHGNQSVKPQTTMMGVVKEARFEVLKALLKTEFNLGNVDEAWSLTERILALKPKHKSTLKLQGTIRKMRLKNRNMQMKEDSGKKNSKKPNRKSTKDLLIEELCRSAAITPNVAPSSTQGQRCTMEHNNLPQLLLNPLKIEYLSIDPYIVIYHDAISLNQINIFKDYLMASDDTIDRYSSNALKFTTIGQKKLTRFTEQALQRITGHASALYDTWQVAQYNYEGEEEIEEFVELTHPARSKLTLAHVLFKLQTSKLGGAIVFPQLEMIVNLPANALLYWSSQNEFKEQDYRTALNICPVIAGTQLLAYNAIDEI